jgi:hypothetical protein
MTTATEAKVAQLVATAETWSRGRSKRDGTAFWIIPASTGATAHWATASACTCRSFYFRGTCSHQPAVKAREDRERAALQTSDRYPVRPTDPYHYCPCGLLIACARRRCDACAERGV